MTYLLDCECGIQIPVGEGMAGASVTCRCGRRIAVPSLAELRRRPPGPEDAAQAAAPQVLETAPPAFTPEHTAVIGGVATCMRIVGVAFILIGGIQLASGLTILAQGGCYGVVQGVLSLVIGGLTFQAALAFGQVADGPGDPFRRLMGALESLWTVYRLQVALLIIGLIGSLTVLIVALASM